MNDKNHDNPSEPSKNSSRYESELNALHRISSVMTIGAGQQEVLEEVLAILCENLGMNRGTVMLLSLSGKELMLEVAYNLSKSQLRAVRYSRGEGIMGSVVKTGKPAVIPKVSKEPRFLDKLHKQNEYAKDEISFICVPISIGSEVVGVLSADRVFDESAPLDEDVRLLSIVTGMIAHDVKSRRIAAAQSKALEMENTRLRHELEGRFRPENILGNSNEMRDVYLAINQVAPSDATVLIRGESGTGKELAAHAVHFASHRAKGPFIRVNCAALSENLLESELFGHEKGAFTGAIRQRNGMIAQADGGTIFLDEIGDFSPAIQVKLLRFLQEREFQPVGGDDMLHANVRIVAATNKNLEQAVDADQFRQDLYYRVNVFPILLPPLRDRKDDILLLADHFVEKYAGEMRKDIRRITTAAINIMFAYHWPGNVRELENCIERAVLVSSDNVIHAHHLPPTLQTSDASQTIGTGSLEEKVNTFERELIVDALKRSAGNMKRAAADLDTTARILNYKAKKLAINYKKYRKKN